MLLLVASGPGRVVCGWVVVVGRRKALEGALLFWHGGGQRRGDGLGVGRGLLLPRHGRRRHGEGGRERLTRRRRLGGHGSVAHGLVLLVGRHVRGAIPVVVVVGGAGGSVIAVVELAVRRLVARAAATVAPRRRRREDPQEEGCLDCLPQDVGDAEPGGAILPAAATFFSALATAVMPVLLSQLPFSDCSKSRHVGAPHP